MSCHMRLVTLTLRAFAFIFFFTLIRYTLRAHFYANIITFIKFNGPLGRSLHLFAHTAHYTSTPTSPTHFAALCLAMLQLHLQARSPLRSLSQSHRIFPTQRILVPTYHLFTLLKLAIIEIRLTMPT